MQQQALALDPTPTHADPDDARRPGPRILAGPLTRDELVAKEKLKLPLFVEPRPRTRRDCLTVEEAHRLEARSAEREGRWPRFDDLGDGCNAERPCPFVSCKYSLVIDALPSGSLKIYGDPATMGETCSLDIADRDGVTLETIATASSCTRERVRQIELRAKARATGKLARAGLDASDLPTGTEHPLAAAAREF